MSWDTIWLDLKFKWEAELKFLNTADPDHFPDNKQTTKLNWASFPFIFLAFWLHLKFSAEVSVKVRLVPDVYLAIFILSSKIILAGFKYNFQLELWYD